LTRKKGTDVVKLRKTDKIRIHYDASASDWCCTERLDTTESTDMRLDDVRLTSHDMADSDPGFSDFASLDTGSWLGTVGRAARIKTTLSAKRRPKRYASSLSHAI